MVWLVSLALVISGIDVDSVLTSGLCCHCSELSLYGVYILKHVFGSLQRWGSSSAGYTCWPQALLSILKLFLSWKTGFPEFMCNL